MKRTLMACLGMLLLGAAGLIVVHQTIDSPPVAQAQPEFERPFPSSAGGGRPPGQPGQFKDLVPVLIESLADTDASVRQLAAATLVKIGPDAVKPLVDALKAKEKDLRANAAYVLGQLGDTAGEAITALAKALKDEDKDVRRRAAFAVHSIVSHSESSGGSPAGLSSGFGGGPGAGLPGGPMPSAGSHSPMDPGLLVPPATLAPKLEKAP